MSTRLRRLAVLLPLLLIPCATGCLARQVMHDGVKVRQALEEMYTDQIMDNLIRARCQLPFVQVTYADATVQDNDVYGGTASGSESLTEVLMTALERTYATMFSIQGNASRSRTMSFVMNPVTDQNDVYEAYLAFAQNPELFMVSCTDPGCQAHIVRKRGKNYYWVPVSAAPAFLDLAMKTSFMRGPETAPPGAYEVTVTNVEAVRTNQDPKTLKVIDPKRPGDLLFTKLTFSASIPNGNATMVAKLADGRTIKMELRRITTKVVDGEEVQAKEGEPTSVLTTLAWSPQSTGYTELDLINAKARIYSHDFPIDAPAPAPQALSRIRSDVNFIRNQRATFRR